MFSPGKTQYADLNHSGWILFSGGWRTSGVCALSHVVTAQGGAKCIVRSCGAGLVTAASWMNSARYRSVPLVGKPATTSNVLYYTVSIANCSILYSMRGKLFYIVRYAWRLSTTRPVITLIGCNAVGRASRFFGRQVFFLSCIYFLTANCFIFRICFIGLCRKIAH